ncbi:MAG: TonB C-terminal domain-containing protein, partial [Myxococcota bacterium]
NAAESPFASYIAAMHRKIHVCFHRFLDGLPTAQSNALSDANLHTRLEIVLNSDGSIEQIGIVRSSGQINYDYGTYNAIVRAAPFNAPPEAIRSPDGLVYLHWDFLRQPPFCHQSHARPYILSAAAVDARAAREDDAAGYESAVPAGQSPSWRASTPGSSTSDGEQGEDEGESEGGGDDDAPRRDAPNTDGAPPPSSPTQDEESEQAAT